MAALTNYNQTDTETLEERCRLMIPIRSVSEANEAWADWTRALRELRAATGEPNFPAFENPQRDPFVDHFISTVLSGPPWMFIKYNDGGRIAVYEGYVHERAVVTQCSDSVGFSLHVGGSDALEAHEIKAFYGPCGWRMNGCIHVVGLEQEEYVDYFPSRICVRSSVLSGAVKVFFKEQWRRYKESEDLLRLELTDSSPGCACRFDGSRRRMRAIRHSGGAPVVDLFGPDGLTLSTRPPQRRRVGPGPGSEDEEDEQLICKPWPCKVQWRSLTGERARECPACLEDTTELTHKMFSCGHFMCVSCINKSAFQWKCPSCRVKIAQRAATLNFIL